MRFLRRIDALEKQNIALATEIKEMKDTLKAIVEKLPSYEEAVSKGVDDVWNKAMMSIVNYDPFSKVDSGGDL